MPQVLVTESYLQAIGDAIRYKNGSENDYTPAEMAPAIRAIVGTQEGYLLPSGTFEISANGEYDIAQYANVRVNFTPPTVAAGHVVEDANGIVTFSAESGLVAQTKTVTPNNTTQVITPDNGYDTLTSVTVNPVSLQNKTITPTESQQSISADNGYAGLGTITINAIPNTYIPASSVITYYVDSSTPTSSDGNNGDIWLVTGG